MLIKSYLVRGDSFNGCGDVVVDLSLIFKLFECGGWRMWAWKRIYNILDVLKYFRCELYRLCDLTDMIDITKVPSNEHDRSLTNFLITINLFIRLIALLIIIILNI